MNAELAEISDFINAIPPFDHLSNADIQRLTKSINIEYVRQGQKMPPDDAAPHLYILRKGALAYYDQTGELLSKYGEGDLCSVFLFADDAVQIRVAVEEDTLLYAIPKPALLEAIDNFTEATAFFNQTAAQRLQNRMQKHSEDAVLASTLSNSLVADFYHGPAATVDVTDSIQFTAMRMNEMGYSCLLVTANGHMVGIVTDKDIRRRCVAVGLDIQAPVAEIMSTDVITLDVNYSAYDALIMMTSRHVHHLPVTDAGQLAGVVTVTDLMNQEGDNAINLVHLIRKAKNLDELVRLSEMLPRLQVRMARLGTLAEHAGKSISAITTALTKRLIALAEEQLGPAPVPYAWLAGGSQARQEQFSHSDQDNALIIDDTVQPEHDVWFKGLAKFVCDGLAACGFVYCPGDVMATNAKWRQAKSTWHQYFSQWVDTPKPSALMYSSIFFDLATVHGDEALLADVRQKMLAKTVTNSLFIAHLSRNALQLRPPLGFFRGFVLVENGDNEKALDLKHNGIAPIVDLARIYALQEGVTAVSTVERLKQVAGTPSLTRSSARNLIDAFEFLGYLRLVHQADQIQAGKEPTNFMNPKVISKLEREHLKDAFKVIKTLQNNRQVTY
ncbi:MAG TPA: hypothetical protein DE179_14120 [Oceanospirillaceae bacterium]|nr:hypothetical protein [Oceanospirillaceae bacterium]